jgi:hypothetical protein
MLPYEALYPVGAPVRIADRVELEQFRTSWHFHNPLSDEQLAYADQATTVKEVGFYHGGDVLYQLEGVPGTWHEQLLRAGAGARAV